MKQIVMTVLAVAAMIVAGCGSNSEEKAAAGLLEQAKAEYANKEYGKALATIDSLRKAYPKQVEARKAALALHQEVSLAQAQEALAEVDGRLQAVSAEYERMKAAADSARAALKATPEQLQAVTLKRIERDSLQTRYDVECAKIKYIHKRQKE